MKISYTNLSDLKDPEKKVSLTLTAAEYLALSRAVITACTERSVPESLSLDFLCARQKLLDHVGWDQMVKE